MHRRLGFAERLRIILTLLGSLAMEAEGALVFNFRQEEGVVVVVTSGALDINATQGIGGVAVNPFVWLHPSKASLGLVGNLQSDYYYVSADRWTPFGAGGYQSWLDVSGVVSSGDRVALFVNSSVGVPRGYVSGAQLHGVTTLPGDYASWGLSPGIYVTEFGSGGVFDTVTVSVEAIPEPATLLLAGLSVGWLALLHRRKQAVRR